MRTYLSSFAGYNVRICSEQLASLDFSLSPACDGPDPMWEEGESVLVMAYWNGSTVTSGEERERSMIRYAEEREMRNGSSEDLPKAVHGSASAINPP